MPKAAWLVMAAFLAVGLVLRWESLGTRVLWYDEVYSLRISEQRVATLVRESITTDPHPPGYYLLLSGWRHLLGYSPQVARALSLVAWLLSVAGLGLLVRGWFGWQVAMGAVGLLSVHAFQVIASTEARMYALLQLAGIIATGLLWRASQTGRPAHWAAYGASVAAMAYVSYYSTSLLLAHGLWVLLTRKTRPRSGPLAALAAALACYLPWLPWLPQSVTANTVPWREPPDANYVLALLMTQVYGGHWSGAAGYYGGSPLQGWQALAGLAPTLLLPWGFATLRSRNAQAAGLLAACWLVPVATNVALSFALGKVASFAYHLTYLQPFAAVLAAGAVSAAWSYLKPSRERIVPALAALALLAYAGHGADAASRYLRYQPYRYDLAARYLQALHRKGDTVLYLPQGMRRVMHVYLRLEGPEVQLSFELAAWGPGAREARQRFRREVGKVLEASTTRVWVVASPPLPPWVFEVLAEAGREAGYVLGPVARFGLVTVGLLVRQTQKR